MKTLPIKIDSIQYQKLLAKIDSLNNSIQLNKPDTSHPALNIGNTVRAKDIETWELSWWMEI